MLAIWAAAETSGADPIGTLAAQGAFGLVAALAILGAYWVIRRIEAGHLRELDGRDAEIERLTGEVRALREALEEAHTYTRDRTVPALTDTGQALVRSSEINREYLQALSRRGRG
jgi:hypothetical protein